MAPNLIQSEIIFSQSRQRFNGKDEIHSDFPIQPTISLAEKDKKEKINRILISYLNGLDQIKQVGPISGPRGISHPDIHSMIHPFPQVPCLYV